MADTFKFRIDHHGSLVRPPEVLAARAADDPNLRAVEDAAIAETVRKQRRLSLTVVTDGHFRRADLASVITGAVHGFEDGQLKAERSLVADDTAAIAAQTQIPAKATLPSPAWIAARTFRPGGPWASARELGEALALLLREEIEAVISRGVRLIQIDNHGYGKSLYTSGGVLGFDDAVAVDALAVAVADKPFDVRIGLCPLTRVGDGLDTAAAERLFAAVPVDRWILPYDTGAPAETELLRVVPTERDVCLGIVDPRVPELEDVGTVMDRMDVVASIRDIEDVAISPSAGFADVAGQPLIGVEDQWRKLIHVETFARMCWGNEL
ncbi:5-methyltetrahydropteroyltriglutamate--homocysteine methyltransferase [Actinoplanes lobatus]|uniref:5-methyltetrahydropteroyltriglutamate--homocysteine methyltransferase n=1 Tax=Actinoplanes lobatus TaxID=113568 RepID=A0A7W7HPZ9_9ACTN|nr:methionine synthase II (cobalamin-independent)-like protein [Actinoplanes lobatus]MBB4754581.1 5-methyltetrahydropteroyltriglutamate--homocysteine methyltransferase [Actinoplanes lobatus]GGN66376.1 5-methyltetrahydropteroyltriglutamate--homocysteine methyltransferase [Actinoplanes lobatus]GIE42567.1 5-methyltetrahydropteroyltriglutamate--homocysteine methyltransferase [Actinoplanes lobatus]